MFTYNNADLVLAGRIIEMVTGMPYETAVQTLVLDPLQLGSTHYFSDQIVGLNIAASHDVVDGKPVVDTGFWAAPDGTRLLSPQSLQAMRSNPGPGGTLQVELTGMGVTWMLRPSAENVTIVQHGGTWPGQHSGFFMVPERNFIMTLALRVDHQFACGTAISQCCRPGAVHGALSGGRHLDRRRERHRRRENPCANGSRVLPAGLRA